MNFEVTAEFEKSLKRLGKKYPSLKKDYENFLEELEQNPLIGDEIFPNCRKARIAIKSKGKGKSGGGRIIFYIEVTNENIVLLYAYDKSEMENVQTAFIEQILELYYKEK
ncbi:MAG: addiction module toxin RelE [Prevotellaceae bacterium]|jgi:mRNA-degrading endonuclease RelE of RelBE toxin-antitoxin system|nr:addiction module toxin RelE [Prevotellaceae bacterium]